MTEFTNNLSAAGLLGVTLWVHGDQTPVCKAVVSREGQVLEDVTEVIA